MSPDLCRRILLAVQDAPGAVDVSELTTDEDDRARVVEHLRLLDEAGYLEASFFSADSRPDYFVSVDRLTYRGQEFASKVRSASAWASVKRRLSRAGVSLGMSALEAAASQLVSSALG